MEKAIGRCGNTCWPMCSRNLFQNTLRKTYRWEFPVPKMKHRTSKLEAGLQTCNPSPSYYKPTPWLDWIWFSEPKKERRERFDSWRINLKAALPPSPFVLNSWNSCSRPTSWNFLFKTLVEDTKLTRRFGRSCRNCSPKSNRAIEIAFEKSNKWEGDLIIYIYTHTRTCICIYW